MTDKDKDLFSEKVITIDMVENDFIVKMPPKNRYKVRVRVKEVKRGEPRVVQPDEFQLYKRHKKRIIDNIFMLYCGRNTMRC